MAGLMQSILFAYTREPWLAIVRTIRSFVLLFLFFRLHHQNLRRRKNAIYFIPSEPGKQAEKKLYFFLEKNNFLCMRFTHFFSCVIICCMANKRELCLCRYRAAKGKRGVIFKPIQNFGFQLNVRARRIVFTIAFVCFFILHYLE